MTEAVETVDNNGSAPLQVWVEPWAEGLIIPPGGQLTFSGASELPGGLEVERSAQGVVVYAWAGSTMVVRNGDTIIRTYDIPVPGIPAAMSMKGFVRMMFGEATSSTTALAPPKPWWRFW